MSEEKFAGDKKETFVSPTAALEKRFVTYWTPRIPQWLETYHLTLMTIVWSAGVLLFGWLAREDPRWLWPSSGMIFLQWLTDCFDGSVGRHRKTGLKLWGFYMDHLLDYFFMGSVFVGLYAPREHQ